MRIAQSIRVLQSFESAKTGGNPSWMVGELRG